MEDDGLVARLRAAGCVFAEDEAALLRTAAADAPDLERLVERRVAGEPLEQILGWVDFAGVRVLLDPGVFVPRQRSALLVEVAARSVPRDGVLLDLCCGSGALGAAVLRRRPDLTVVAADLDVRATDCARRNLPASTVVTGDLYDALPRRWRGRFDLIVANAPYVPTAQVRGLPPEAREHEPRHALDGGIDGLDVHRRIVDGAVDWLAWDGRVVVEVAETQRAALTAALIAAGLDVETDETDGTAAVSAIRRRGPG